MSFHGEGTGISLFGDDVTMENDEDEGTALAALNVCGKNPLPFSLLPWGHLGIGERWGGTLIRPCSEMGNVVIF